MIGFGEDFSQLLEGEPDAVVARSERLSAQAQAIADAAQTLTDLASGQIAKSATELRSRSADVQTAMLQAQQRYDETATALKTYGVKLGPIKSQAGRDIEALERARERAGQAMWAAGDAQRRQVYEKFINSPADVQQDTADDLARAQRQSEAAQAEVQEILRRLRSAVAEKEQIAQAAMSAIDMVIGAGKDTLLDNIAQVFDGIGDFFAAIGKWISGVIDGVLQTISDIWNAILPKIMTVLVLSLIPMILGGLGWAGGFLLGGPLLAGITGPLLFGLGVGVSSLIAGLLVWRIKSDVFAPDPKVTKLEKTPTHLGIGAKPQRSDFDTDEAYQLALRDWENTKNVLGRPSLDNAFAEAGLVDDLGGTAAADDKGVIRVEKVVGADGVARWRVVLPSTQDWVFGADGIIDAGATNDLDSNLALMLTPEMQTQYERAVLDAMQQAGVGKDDPVMLVGFSQGGIMAGHLAANRSELYNFQAVMAAGSPIDAMRIPPKTEVISMQHVGDPVPWGPDALTNLKLGAEQNDHWRTFTPVAPGHEYSLWDPAAHNASLYNLSWQNEMANVPPEVLAEFEQFYAHDGSQQVVTSEYEWSE